MSELCYIFGVSPACEHKLQLHFPSSQLLLKETAATLQLVSHFIKAVINYIQKNLLSLQNPFILETNVGVYLHTNHFFSQEKAEFFGAAIVFLMLSKHSLSESFMSQSSFFSYTA